MANIETKHETVLDAGTTRARLARIYAEALLASALKQSPGAADEVGAELTDFSRAVSENPGLGVFLGSPIVGKKARGAVLATALEGRASHSLRGLIAVLAQNNRLNLLQGIAQAYRALINERSGRVPVKVTAAIELSDEQKTKLTANLKDVLKQEPVLDVRVDPALLGGLVVQVGDSVVDTSVRTRLQSLRTLLLDKGGSHGN